MSERTVTFEITVPEDVYTILRAYGMRREALAERSRRLLALQFYRDRMLSLEQAARLAGMGYWEFIEFLSEHDTPVLDYDEEELEAELVAMGALQAELMK